MGELRGQGGTLGSGSSAEERNKFINNKRRRDVRLGGHLTWWLNLSLNRRTGLFTPQVFVCVHSVCVCVCVLSYLYQDSCKLYAEYLDCCRVSGQAEPFKSKSFCRFEDCNKLFFLRLQQEINHLTPRTANQAFPFL